MQPYCQVIIPANLQANSTESHLLNKIVLVRKYKMIHKTFFCEIPPSPSFLFFELLSFQERFTWMKQSKLLSFR